MSQDTANVSLPCHLEDLFALESHRCGLCNKIKCSMGASQVALVVKNLPANAGDAEDIRFNPG